MGLSLRDAIEILKLNPIQSADASVVNVIANHKLTQFRSLLAAHLLTLGFSPNVSEETSDSLFDRLLHPPSKRASAHLIVVDSDTLLCGHSLRFASGLAQEDYERYLEKISVFKQAVNHFASLHKEPILLLPVRLDFSSFIQEGSYRSSWVDERWYQSLAALSQLTQAHKHLLLAKPIRSSDRSEAFLETGELLEGELAGEVAQEIAQAIVSLSTGKVGGRKCRKVLITDLDNTFWKGTVSVDGKEGLEWENTPSGRSHFLYQRFLDLLAKEGVQLAICSRNPKELIEDTFQTLKFACPSGNFSVVVSVSNKKSEAIGKILTELKLKPEEAVFVDDSASEIEEVSKAFAEMSCFAFPSSLNKIPGFLKDLRGEFQKETALLGQDRAA